VLTAVGIPGAEAPRALEATGVPGGVWLRALAPEQPPSRSSATMGIRRTRRVLTMGMILGGTPFVALAGT